MAYIRVKNANDSGPGSLREAIAQAEDGDVIVFKRAVLKGSDIELDSQIVIDKDIPIVGTNPRGRDANIEISLSANAAVDTASVEGGIFKIANNANVTLSQLNLADGKALNGGAIFVEKGAKLTADELVIENSFAEKFGGGIRVEGEMDIFDSTVQNNDALLGGGGVSVEGDDASAHVINTTVNGNAVENPEKLNGAGTKGDGAGIQVLINADLILEDSTVTGNFALNRYGGVDARSQGATGEIIDSYVAGNTQGANPKNSVDINNSLSEATVGVSGSAIGIGSLVSDIIDRGGNTTVDPADGIPDGVGADASVDTESTITFDADVNTLAMSVDRGEATVVNFDPGMDVLDFSFVRPADVTITDEEGSLVFISSFNETQSFTLEGISADQLSLANLTDQRGRLDDAGGVIAQLEDLGFYDGLA